MSGSFLLFWFTIFFLMSLYLICEMKKFEQTKDRTGDVWFYLYLSNLGILEMAGVNIFNINNILLDSSSFGFSSLFFLIMTFCYFGKLISDTNKIIVMFNCNIVGEWAKLPCFIWSLLGLTDPCCMSTTYIVTTYADGHTESDLWATELWNCFIKVLKRFAYFFTVISFYSGLLFFLFFWLLAKIIFQIIISCIGNPNNMEGNQNQNQDIEIINQNNNQNNNQIDNQMNNQNDNQYNYQNDINSNALILNNNRFEPNILNNRNIYNINLNINGNNNILNNPNNYDKPINVEGLAESANKKEEYNQSYDLPDEEEIKNNNNKVDINQNNENSLNKDTDKEEAPAPVIKN